MGSAYGQLLYMNSTTQKQTLFQVLSIDVVLGSLAVGVFAISILNVSAVSWWWVILPASVWVVYSLDHLIDGLKQKERSTIFRHRFHYLKRKILSVLVLMSGCLAVALSFMFLDNEIIIGGIVLSILVIIYFALVFLLDKFNSNHFFKEFFIAFFYISGIFLAPLVWHAGLPSYSVFFVIACLFLLAWMESVIISYYDYEDDIENGFKSFAIAVGKNRTRKIVLLILSLLTIFLFISIFLVSERAIRGAIIIELAMTIILTLLILFPEIFQKQNRFRWVGESVFYLPALIPLCLVFNT